MAGRNFYALPAKPCAGCTASDRGLPSMTPKACSLNSPERHLLLPLGGFPSLHSIDPGRNGAGSFTKPLANS